MNILKDALLKIHIENAKKFNYLNIHFHNSMFFGIYNEKLYHKHANAILLTLITAVIYLKFNFVIKTILTIVWSIYIVHCLHTKINRNFQGFISRLKS